MEIACSVQTTAITRFIYHHGAIWYGEKGGYCLGRSRTHKSVEIQYSNVLGCGIVEVGGCLLGQQPHPTLPPSN